MIRTNDSQSETSRRIFFLGGLFAILVTQATSETQARATDSIMESAIAQTRHDSKGPLIHRNWLDLETETWTARPGSLTKLEQALVAQLQVQSDSAFLHYLLSHLYLRRYQENGLSLAMLRKASDLAEQAIELKPKQEYGYLAAAQILSVLGKNNEALAMLKQFLHDKHSRFSWRTRLEIIKLIGNDNTAEKSLHELEILLSEGGNRQLIIPLAVVLLEKSRRGEDLLHQFRYWATKYPHPVMSMSLALNLSRQKEFADANKILEGIRKNGIDYAKYPEAAINQAVLLYRYLNKPNKARLILNEALKQQAKTSDMMGTIHTHIGMIWLGDKSLQKAEQAFLTALQHNPEAHWHTLDFIVETYKKENLDRALTELVGTLVLSLPGNPKHHELLGDIHGGLPENSNYAIESYRNASLLNPREARYWSKIGFLHYQSQSYQESQQAFSKAVELNPDDALTLYNYACTLALSDQLDRALSFLERAIEMEPQFLVLARNEADFKILRDLPHFRLLTGNSEVELSK